MITILLIIAIAAALLGALLLSVRRPQAAGVPGEVDLAAFRTLMDRSDEEFLRGRLPAKDFKRLRRERLRVAGLYLKEISTHADCVARHCATAANASDVAAANQARELAQVAASVRINAMVLRVRLEVARWVPLPDPNAQAILASYSRMLGGGHATRAHSA